MTSFVNVSHLGCRKAYQTKAPTLYNRSNAFSQNFQVNNFFVISAKVWVRSKLQFLTLKM